MRTEDDSLFKLCQLVNTQGLTRGEVRLLLKQALLKSQLRIGRLASLLRHIHVGFGTVSEAPRDVLPMPVCPADINETRILQALAAGALPADVRRDFPRAMSVLEHFGRQVDYFLKDDKPLPGKIGRAHV